MVLGAELKSFKTVLTLDVIPKKLFRNKIFKIVIWSICIILQNCESGSAIRKIIVNSKYVN